MQRVLTRCCAALAAGAMLLAAGGCGGNDGNDSNKPSASATTVMRLGTSAQIDSLNPFVGTAGPDYFVWNYTYPHLTGFDTELQPQPSFAKSWTASGATITFELTPDAKWSDGQPLTAKDAAWTLNTMVKFQEDATALWQAQVKGLEKAEAADEDTLVLTYAGPNPSAIARLAIVPILPEHVWSQHATGKGAALKTYRPEAKLPYVSGGPFVVKSYEENANLIMVPNENWFGPKGNLSVFGINFYGSPDAMIAALKNDEVDGISPAPPSAVDSLEADGFEILESEGNQTRVLAINSNAAPERTKHRELLEPGVKEAMDLAMDREQMIRVAFNGRAELATSLVPPRLKRWHNPDLEPTPFDVDKANEILDGLGYKRGAGGIRQVDGQPMSYSVITDASDTFAPRLFSILKNNYAKIGIELTQRNLSDPFTAALAPDGKYLTADLVLDYYGSGPDPGFNLSVTTCAGRGGQSDNGYCNPKYDALFEKQAAEVDEDKRLEIAYEMQEMIYNDRPWLFMMYPVRLEAFGSKWQDIPAGGASVSGAPPLNTDFLLDVRAGSPE